MKNVLLLFVVILCVSCHTTRQLSTSQLLFTEGDDLFYKVQAGNEEYDFELNMNGKEDHYISFDWDIPQRNASGTIAMREEAITEAKAMHNYMQSGYLPLKDRTSVWASQAVLKELKAKKAVEIDLDGKKEVFKMAGSDVYTFGKKQTFKLPIIIAKSQSTDKEIWIVDDIKSPLIVKMKLDFNIHLVNYQKFE